MRLKGMEAKTYRWEIIISMWADGKKQAFIGKALKISQSSVSRVIRMHTKDGSAVPKKHKGAACRLSDAQKAELSAILAAGSEAYGFEGAGWTNKRIAKVIMEKFGVKYGERQPSKIANDLGFTKQRFKAVDKRQNPEEMAQWRDTKLPGLKKSTTRGPDDNVPRRGRH